VSEPTPLWNIVIKIAVEAAGETEARAIAELLLSRMEVAPTEALVFVCFDDGTWATELRVDDPGFEQVEPNDPISVLSCLTKDLGPVQWAGHTDTPFDPESARAGQLEWPPSYWAMAGRKEMLVHPSVRAVLLQAHRTRTLLPGDVTDI
jgi:hypothetical protein